MDKVSKTIKVSELIAQLQAILKESGDLPVFTVEFGGITDVEGASVEPFETWEKGKKEKTKTMAVFIE